MLILSPYYLYLSDLSHNELLSLIDTVFYNWFQETKNQVRYWQKDQILSQGGYLVNLLIFLSVMCYVSIKQIGADYQCPSYTVGSECSRLSDIVSLLLYIAYRNCLLSY